jgi:hypothetical protein
MFTYVVAMFLYCILFQHNIDPARETSQAIWQLHFSGDQKRESLPHL